ncbi:MAG: tetratricopeptide repeat-containing glycosyltransferase family protein [Rhodospirillaceae bacterium]|nr:tetratricopeptide repeat-containing glycosyltransferase family protein [Rhodospirillaceae bacterium]
MELQNPTLVRTLFQRAFAAHNAGNVDAATALYAQVLALAPQHFDALHLSGVAALQKNDPAKAVELITRALKADKTQQAAFSNRAAAYLALNNPKAALADLDQAVALAPRQAEAHYNRGKALMALGRHDEALTALDRALALNPRHVDAHVTRGTLVEEQGNYPEAVAAAERALALDANKFEARFNRAHALGALGETQAAIDGYTAALALVPGHVSALNNRGNLYRYANRFDAALADYARAGTLDPQFSHVRVNAALCLFALERFADAWPLYEWRLVTPELSPILDGVIAPRWDGRTPLAGKRILVIGEQGLGDILQFSRFAPALAKMGADVRLEVPAALTHLLGRLPGVSIHEKGQPRPPTDFHIPLLSLPLALGVTAETISGAPYLSADPGKVAAWAARTQGAALKVGLVWAGSPQKGFDSKLSIAAVRALPLKAFAPLRAIPGVTWFSLQKGEPAAELPALKAAGWDGPEIVDLTGDIHDFDDTAGFVANLDLVISCDTSVVHLAGGLGKTVWVLNRTYGCWRFPPHRTDSPWYRGARVFHQPSFGDWDAVIADVKAALEAIPSPSPSG